MGTARGGGGSGDPHSAGVDVRLLQAGWVTSAFDRFVIGPMLLTIAADLDVSLTVTAKAASLYFLGYGLSQPLWGWCLDRFGRVRTMRLTLGAAALCGVMSALAPSATFLIVARACTGVFIGAVVPAGMVYVGDVIPYQLRQRALADLNAALAAGIAVAIALGGVLASSVSWRVGFVIPAASAGILALALSRLPEPTRDALRQQGIRSVLRQRWALVVVVLALVEGAALLGVLTYLAPSLESAGASPTTAGAVVGVYGVGLLISSVVVKRLVWRYSATMFLATGAAGLTVAYAAVAALQTTWVVGATALLLGAAWAPLNSTMQTWATQVVPAARAGMVSLFVAMVFVGSGLGTAALAPWAGRGQWTALFLVGVALAAAFGLTAPFLRLRYDATTGSSND